MIYYYIYNYIITTRKTFSVSRCYLNHQGLVNADNPQDLFLKLKLTAATSGCQLL